MTFSLKTIVWDIDDVLNDSTRTWLDHYWRPGHPGCAMQYEQLTENPPHRLLDITRDDYLTSLDAFRLSPQAAAMRPDAKLIAWFQENAMRYRHIALTARPRKTAAAAFNWVLLYFGNWFQTFSFVPAERKGEAPGHPDRDKAGFLSWLNRADYFIDDNSGNVEAARCLGIKSFLVSRPWNSGGCPLEQIINNELGK